MGTHLKIISQKEIRVFDNPPEFNGEQRKKFFSVAIWTREILERFRTPTNKIGFVLQLGYFKAVNKFFVANRFHQNDIEFVTSRLEMSLKDICLEEYKERSFERHQEIILKKLGWKKFNEDAKTLLIQETFILCSKQTKPRLMFLSLVDFLRYKKTEAPTYYAIAEIITQTLRDFEKNLVSLVQRNLSEEDQQMLDDLLKEEEYLDGKKKDRKLKRHRLTLLKQSNQSTKPSRIKENISDLQSLHTIFQKLEPVISKLGLSSEIVLYYAQIVIKSKIFQMHRREEKKHILLLTFVIHQFYQLNDIIIEILMHTVQSALNSSIRDNKEKYYEERKSRHQGIAELSQKLTKYLDILEKIEITVRNMELSDEVKVGVVKQFLLNDPKMEYISLQEKLEDFGKESSRITKNEDYYDVLESKSIKLQNRVSDIVKHLEFDELTSNKSSIEAINYYKNKDGILTRPPLDFLDPDKQSRVFDKQEKLRISLYKVLLFEHVASGIKSGALNLKYSYKYRAFDDYLIPKKIWETEQNKLLSKAGLLTFKKFGSLEVEFQKVIRTQFQTTNQNVMTTKNPHVTIGTDGALKVKTPPKEKDILDTHIDLFRVFSYKGT